MHAQHRQTSALARNLTARIDQRTQEKHSERRIAAFGYGALLAAAFAAVGIVACETPRTHDSEACRIARNDVAAGEACLAELNCAARWDSPTFRHLIDNARDDVARYCEVQP